MVSMTLYLMDLGNTIEMGGLVKWSTKPTFLSSSRSVVYMSLQTLLLMNGYFLSVRICLTKRLVGTQTNCLLQYFFDVKS